MKKKSIIILGLLLVPLLWNSFTQTSAAWLSLWSVRNGDYRIYQLLREQRDLNNKLIGTMDKSFLQYTILNESDILLNGYSDLALLYTDYSTVPETVTETLILDLTWLLEAQQAAALVFNQLHDSELLQSVRTGPGLLGGANLILTANSYRTLIVIIWFYYGINWTTAMNGVNTTLTGYTAYNQTPYAYIDYLATNQNDAALFADYNETGTIIWNMKTGWLESLEYNRTYEAPLSFSIITKIKPYFQSITSEGEIISLKDIFAWLGVTVGVASLCFVLYVVKKAKR
jgi:hypothetical protein